MWICPYLFQFLDWGGDLVQQDLVKCEQLWERAAEQGDDMARENLATLREHLKLAQKGG